MPLLAHGKQFIKFFFNVLSFRNTSSNGRFETLFQPSISISNKMGDTILTHGGRPQADPPCVCITSMHNDTIQRHFLRQLLT